jgi:hypothetical protein
VPSSLAARCPDASGCADGRSCAERDELEAARHRPPARLYSGFSQSPTKRAKLRGLKLDLVMEPDVLIVEPIEVALSALGAHHR